MQLRDALAALGVPELEETFTPHWEDSVAVLSAGTPYFLAPEYLRESAGFCGLDAGATAAVLEVAGTLRDNPALLHLAWHMHRLVFGPHTDYSYAGYSRWPLLEGSLGDRAGVLYLIVALSGVRLAREHDAALGISEEITRANLRDIPINNDRFGRFYPGRTGILPRVVYWFRNHTHNNLYTLGRFQYVVRGFGGQVLVYRNRETRQVLALSEPGVRFDREGFRAHPEAQPDGDACWEATFESDAEAFTGHPILPEGVAWRRRVRLAAGRWEQTLVRGEPVLEMHIPGGGGMTPERCEDSMRQALEFFPRFFPQTPFKAFACQSWIMNPQFADFYSPTCNLVRYQRETYLYPYPWAANGGVFFIFDAESIDPKTAPRDTSIRRAMADHLEQGGILRNGGMFFFPEEMPRFGTQAYRADALFDWLREGRAGALAEVGVYL